MACATTATASGRSDLPSSLKGRGQAPRLFARGQGLAAIGFLLTPVAMGFLASAWYFPGADAAYSIESGLERRGQRRSSEVGSFGTTSTHYNPANLCAAGASCSKIERHDKRYSRRILPRSSTSKQSTYGSGHYVGLRRN